MNHVEVSYYHVCKHNQNASGDIFVSQKDADDGRIIATLSDGMGSGVKAGVLATLTATMATKFVSSDIPIKKAAEIIMDTLPVCKERGISYATFTIVDCKPNDQVKIMEYDNPPYILIRNQCVIEPIKEQTLLERKNKKTAPKREAILSYSKFDAEIGDRLVFFSDGVTQAGMGKIGSPFGMGYDEVQNFILEKIEKEPSISARDLSHSVVSHALMYDKFNAEDDITCAVIYFRLPRKLLVVSGPPVEEEKDALIASIFDEFDGKKIVCGGTTANLISRELSRPLKCDLKDYNPLEREVPPISRMDGAEFVTEGVFTLSKVCQILEDYDVSGLKNTVENEKLLSKNNAATKIVELFLNSDFIQFVVGTRINQANQGPNMTNNLEIRRNLIKRIGLLLEEKYLKEVEFQYF